MAAEGSRAIIDPHSPLSYKPPPLAVIPTAELLPNMMRSPVLVVRRFRRRSGPYSQLWFATAAAQHRGSRRCGPPGPPLVPPLVALAARARAASLDTLGAGLPRVSQPPDRWRADRRRPAQALDLAYTQLSEALLAGVHLVPIGPEGQSALDGDPDDRQRRRFGTRSYGDLSDAVVVIGELVRAGGVVVCEGLALACRRSEPVVVTFGAAGWSSEATAFALGRFASVMLARSGSRTGRETAGALGRRVQAYGGNRRVPHVRRASDVAIVAGSLTLADPGRFKEMTQIYANIGLPRWEATRRAYTEVAWPQRR